MAEIAIVGGGVAGIGAAYGLTKAGHSVTLFESEAGLGGHCLGSEIAGPDGSTIIVDVGVSDFNRATFTNVGALFAELELRDRPINQDASFMRPDRSVVWHLEGGEAIFRVEVDRRLLLGEMSRFRTECVEVLEDPTFRDWTLGRYLDDRDYSEVFRDLYLYPRAQGSFPMPDCDPSQYHVRGLVAFWRMHGLAGAGPADRRALVGGMHTYGAAFAHWLRSHGGVVRTSTEAVGIARSDGKVRLRALDAERRPATVEFEHLVLAVRSNQVLPLLEDASEEEKRAFDGFRWQRATVTVHHDPLLMPADRETWGAYNYLVGDETAPRIRPTISFYPNRLVGLDPQAPDTFVSVNPFRLPDPERIVSQHFFLHPAVTASTDIAQARVDQLQGRRNTWYCGSYLTQPWVHEQAFSSGLDLAERIHRGRSSRSADRRAWVADFLRRVPWLSDLDTSVLADLSLVADSFSLAAGEALFEQNDPADGMYLIEHGTVQISSRTLGDESVELTKVGEGAIVGELSLIDGGLRSAGARAVTATRGYLVRIERFEALKTDLRPAAFELLDRIGVQLAGTLRRSLDDISREPVEAEARVRSSAGAAPDVVQVGADVWRGSLLDADDLEAGLGSVGGVFAVLDPRQLHRLVSMTDRGRLDRGAVLYQEGERPEALFMVVRGAVRTTVGRGGRREQVGVYGPGRAVGAAPLLDGESLPDRLEVCEEADLLRLGRGDFESLRKSYSPLAFRLFPELHRALALDLRRLTRHLARVRATRRFNRGDAGRSALPNVH